MPRKPNKSAWSSRGGRSGNLDDKHYFGHDDRVPRNDGGSYLGSRPRVSFKTQARPTRDEPRGLALACLDEDVQMATSSNNNNRQVIIRGRDRGMQRGRNSPVPHRRFRSGPAPRMRQLGINWHKLPIEANWYKITIPYGHRYEKEYVITNLHSYIAPEIFVPIMYMVVGNEANFYVDDYKIAIALHNCDRKITTTDGYKMQVAVLDIVAEHIPDLEALNLDGNKLQILEKLNVLSKKFKKLKILYIGDNKIKDIYQIDMIKDLKLEELKLAGNPVCNKYKTRQNDYISDVRKRFPKLLRLDGMELPKPILFDVVDEGNKMPLSQRMFVANSKAQEIASQFLQQYFLIFDSENRQPLLDAYDEHACFSMTVSYSHNSNKLNRYLIENRNLYRVNDTNKRHKLLKQGRLPVVSFISEMPQTSHYLNTFTMDISLVTQGMMLITVTGLFKELDKKEQFIRYFNRTFIIVPEGSGYCIRNEQLHINQPTDAQLKQLNTQPEGQMTSNPISQTPSSSNTAKPLPAPLPEDVKQQMTLTLSQQTNMNLEWSLKCLEEVLWNYDNALLAFQEFYKRGQIPPEAFNK
ncbi:Nuclear RNA export factor 1 [Habropoda laboriosa]|uniref:Nuclear RNA export factor 1 n=1 Tax=Habropoda laboriosa TaxID=597456 RepID=A0A0L7RBF8_9HYME|nr:Nuclear RNA export factor 1 [Habropoda laboriosa]